MVLVACALLCSLRRCWTWGAHVVEGCGGGGRDRGRRGYKRGGCGVRSSQAPNREDNRGVGRRGRAIRCTRVSQGSPGTLEVLCGNYVVSFSLSTPTLSPSLYSLSLTLSLCTNMTLTLWISLFLSTVLSLPRRDSLLRCLSCLSCALPSLVCAGPPSCALSPCPAFSQVIDGDLESYLETTPFES